MVVIDELRCRPSYAVELLEVAKHIFAVDHVVFVLGVDEGAQILVCKRLSSDMEIPQFADPAASGYVSVTCSNLSVGLKLLMLCSIGLEPERFLIRNKAISMIGAPASPSRWPRVFYAKAMR